MKLIQKADKKDGLYEIDPGSAQKLLDDRQKNRPLREQTAARFARAISNGEWVANGETLIFDGQGRLIDGQHRLRAVVIANRPIISYCVFSSWNRKAFETIDVGRTRQASDLIALDGHKYSSLAAATAKWCMAYEIMLESGNVALASGSRGPAMPTSTMTKRYYDKNEAEIHSACEFIVLHRSLRGIVAGSVAAFTLLMARREDPVKADTFIERLTSGDNLTKASPVWLLRERLLGSGRRKFSADVQLAYLVKTWNAFRAGRSITTLKFSVGEVFPRFQGSVSAE